MKQVIFLFLMLFTVTGFCQTVHSKDINPSGAGHLEVMKFDSISGYWIPMQETAAGLQSVTTDNTLTGDGTVGDALQVNDAVVAMDADVDTKIAASAALDEDKDANNEFQDLNLNGQTLEISNGQDADLGSFATETEVSNSISSITYYDKVVKVKFSNLSSGNSVTITGVTPPTAANYGAWRVVRGIEKDIGTSVTVSNANKTFTFPDRNFEHNETVFIYFPIQ